MFIRTHRLLLRPPWPEDAAAIARGLAEREVAEGLARAPWPRDARHGAAAEGFIARLEALEPQPTFVILSREGDDAPLAGAISLFREGEDGEEEGEEEGGDGGGKRGREWRLGVWLGEGWRGRGYATEAAGAVLELAFLGLRLPRVVAGCLTDNPASGRVLEKLGFAPAAEGGRGGPARDCNVPCRNVALTREGWLAHRASQVEMHAA